MDIHIPRLLQGQMHHEALHSSAQRLTFRTAIPDAIEISEIQLHTHSPWTNAYKVTANPSNGSPALCFMKVSSGPHGRGVLKGKFESTPLIHQTTPDFCPDPIAWGTLDAVPDSHFYLCQLHALSEGLPEPASFCEKLARLHSVHASPGGRFGFHITTYNGNLPQDNTWVDTWEECFTCGIKHAFAVYRQRADSSPELEGLLPDFYDKVTPRLLRPLEPNGRRVPPSLVRGDLWCGKCCHCG